MTEPVASVRLEGRLAGTLYLDDVRFVTAIPALPPSVPTAVLEEKTQAKLMRIEDQVKRIAEVTQRLRRLDAIETNEYIDGGEEMIDVWNQIEKEDET